MRSDAAAAVIVAVSLLCATSARADQTRRAGSFPCEGRWQGLGRNTGFPTAWSIDMLVTAPDASGRCGTIEYTNPRCGGHMLECRVVGHEVHVREHYVHDDGCANAGRLEFSCDGDTMSWAWIGWETARTTLRRVGPAPDRAQPPAPAPPPPPRAEPPPRERRARDDASLFGCTASGSDAPVPAAVWLGLVIAGAGCGSRAARSPRTPARRRRRPSCAGPGSPGP